MSKSKVGSSAAEQHRKMVEEHNANVRASARPAGRAIMDEVQDALDKENAQMDAQFAGDAKLRAWAKELLGFEISMTQIEKLQVEVANATAGKPFAYQGVFLIRTAFGTVDRLDRYVFALERTIVDLTTTNKSIVPPTQQFTDLSFSGLIKLAFKQLFKRSK